MTAPLFTRPDPNLAEVRWLLRELRTAGWRHSLKRWTTGDQHRWSRGNELLVMDVGSTPATVGLFVDGLYPQASVTGAWLRRCGVFAAHDLGVALGVFSDLETRRADHQLLARLIVSPDRSPEALAWMRHRLEKDQARPGRVDDLDGMLARVAARREVAS